MITNQIYSKLSQLVSSINKENSNLTALLNEIQKIKEMSGDDGRFALLVSLFDEFTNRSTPKDPQKIALLQEELQNALRRPNCIQMICRAIESGSRQQLLQQQRMLPDNFIDYICTLANLSPLQSVAFAVGVSQSQYLHVVADAKRYLRMKLPEVIQIHPSEISDEVFPPLMHMISKDFPTAETSSNFISALKNYRLLLSNSNPPNSTTATPPTAATTALSASSSASSSSLQPHRISIARMLLEKGPICTSSVEVFRRTLQEIDIKISEDQLAEMIIFFVARSFQTVTSEDGRTIEQFNSPFSLEVVAEVLAHECRATNLNWTMVVQGFDQPSFTLRSEQVFLLIVRLFIRISGIPLPAAGFLVTWTNKTSQLAFLLLAAASARNIVDFAAVVSADQKIPEENIPTPPNFSWMALPLYKTLLELANAGLSADVLEALNNAASQYPEYVLVCLSQFTSDPSNVRAEILRRILPLFTGLSSSRPTSLAVMQKLCPVNPDLVVLLFRIALKKALTVQDIQDIDTNLSSIGHGIVKKLELEGTIEEFIGFWCVKADRSDFNLEEKVQVVLEANPQCARILINFAKTHLATLRSRSSDGGLISFESFVVLIRAIQSYPTIVPIDELRPLVSLYQTAFAQQQQRVAAAAPPPPQLPSSSSAPPTPSVVAPPPQPTPQVVTEPISSGGGGMLGGGGGGGVDTGLGNPPKTDEVEEEANAYFQKIYNSDISVPDMITLLRKFKSSTEKREQDIFRCMIHNLFDEVRFFHKYPEKELQVTGVLFGTLIQHQLVSSITLGLALRYVLEALRKDPEQDSTGSNDKMFRFGKIAIEQFRSRLNEWPQYCSHLVQITHLLKHYPEIFHDAQAVVNNPQSQAQLSNSTGVLTVPSTATTTPMNATSVVDELSTKTSEISLTGGGGGGGIGIGGSNLSAGGGGGGGGSLSKIKEFVPASAQPPPVVALRVSDEINRMIAVNLEIPILNHPSEAVRDQIHFIINNLAKDNMETKSSELKALMSPEFHPWFANYLVVKRISNQPNFHRIYLQAVLNLDSNDLMNAILDSTYHSVTKLLQGPFIVQSTAERSLLRHLGIWLGLITIARNKPILDRRLNIRDLIFWGYERGRLIAVSSFVTKILESCKESKVFRPPNPWLMGILGVFRELYDLEDLKMNIKFEIQVLCRNIGIKIEDIKKSNWLPKYRPPIKDVNNPDFIFKVGTSTASLPPASPTQTFEESVVPSSPSLSPLPPNSPAPVELPLSSSVSAISTVPPTPTVSSLPSLTTQSSAADQTVIPNLASYIIINPSLQFFTSNPAQKRLVSIAVDRAIREIIHPVVDRSVMVASVTTRQLILKDFASEPNEQQLRSSAHQMASNLAGSLALVTCKEPLRLGICNHLRTLLAQSTQDQTLIEQIVQVCSQDNLDLGSMLIEKASMEKAIREIDENLSSAYQLRRKNREGDQPFSDPAYLPTAESAVCAPGPKFPRDLPSFLKTKVGGLSAQQLGVYEAFQRTTPSPAAVPSSTSTSQPLIPSQPQPTPLTFSQAIESYQQVLVRIDQFFRNLQMQGRELTLAMITTSSTPTDQEIIALSREIVTITQRTQADVRNETALTIGETVFKNLMESVTSDFSLRVEILVTILEALRDIINTGVKRISPEVVASWLESYTNVNSQDEVSRKMHRLILTMLLRTKLIRSQEIDLFFASHMDLGRDIAWVEMALTFVRQCLNDNLAATHEFSRIFDTVSKMRPANSMVKKQLQRYLMELRQLSTLKEGESKQSTLTAVDSNTSLSPFPTSTSATSTSSGPREIVSNLLDKWMRVWSTSNDQVFSQYLQLMQQFGVLKSEEAADRFFKMATELCVEACLRNADSSSVTSSESTSTLSYTVIDALSKLFILLIRLADKESKDTIVRANLLSRILSAIVRSLFDDHNTDLKTQQQLLVQHQQAKSTTPLSRPSFDQRPYFRLFSNLAQDLIGVPDAKQEGSPALFPILHAYFQVYTALQPSAVPGFAFAWLQLISHRTFMPNLLLAKAQKGWPYLQRLIVTLLNFLSPFLKTVQMNDSIRKLYKGTLRMMLVLLHDFPEFLCDYHLSLCDAIPSTCVQMRNLVLSAFPRSMRFPDPLTPNLKVDMLPEISQAPRLLSESFAILSERNVRQYIDLYMTSRSHADLPSQLPSAMLTNGVLNVPLLNATVAYVGTLGAGQLQNKIGLINSPAIDIFKGLVSALDSEGRYVLFNAMANQLRYPNSHTHYFSYAMLLLFVDCENENVQDQITRVLLERLIAHKPHPWGLLITFMELIKNPRYAFWRKPFARISPQIEQVFDSLARSCLGPAGVAGLGLSGSGSTATSSSAPSTPSGPSSAAQNQGHGGALPPSSPLLPPSSPSLAPGTGSSAGSGILGSSSSNGSWLK